MATLFALRRRAAVLLSLLATAGFAVVPVSLTASQSLADVAKKQEDRRKSAHGKVYTNKDLTPVPAPLPDADAAPKAAADTPPEAKKPADKPAADGAQAKDEAYWSGRLKALTRQLERDTTFADALQTKVNSLSTDFVNRDDPAQRAALERDRQKSTAQLAALQKEIAAGKKAIADLREEARRAGVPPGWLR